LAAELVAVAAQVHGFAVVASTVLAHEGQELVFCVISARVRSLTTRVQVQPMKRAEDEQRIKKKSKRST
jgi:hypothetical protein